MIKINYNYCEDLILKDIEESTDELKMDKTPKPEPKEWMVSFMSEVEV